MADGEVLEADSGRDLVEQDAVDDRRSRAENDDCDGMHRELSRSGTDFPEVDRG
jgi:hypothetical protein